MYKARGFTLIELIVVTSMLAVLSATITVNVRQSQIRANDANRVASMRQYQSALELNYATHRTYWVFRPSGAGRDQVSALVRPSVTDNGRLNASPSDRVTYKTILVGYRGAGWGRINAKEGAGNYSQDYSIADALIYQGFLSQVRFDPRMKDPQVITGSATDMASFNDFNLTLCTSNGSIPFDPRTAVSYGVFVQLEQPDRYADSAQVTTYCGGGTTPSGGWDTITTD
jgi:prepilin-type N-terminal cleavage/methylation domain-containing protein